METENGTTTAGGSLLRLGAAACAGEKRGGGGEEQPYDTHGRYLGTLYAANGHVGGGRLPHDAPGPRQSPLGRWPKRGAEIGKHYILHQKIMARNRHVALVYYQGKGTLMDMEDRIVGKGYSGAPGHVNAPDDERLKGQGVIPRGTWIVGPVIERSQDTDHKGENLIKRVPDKTTAERVRAVGRDPFSFYIHADSVKNPGTASEGCIIMPKKGDRMAIRELQAARIRVVR